VTGGVVFLVIAGLLLLTLPRRSAYMPVLLAAAYTPRLPVLELGPASLSVLRILVVVGMVRIVARGEWIPNGLNSVDRLLIAWTVLFIGISAFHTPDAWSFRIGMMLGELGAYILCRIFIQDFADVRRVFMFLCIALVPLAALMLLEKYTAQNLFSIVGQFSEANIRDGRVRAYGPFGHPILAGAVGVACMAMAVSLWRTHRSRALLGLSAGAGIVLASTSSGPILMALFTFGALFVWHMRHALGLIRWATVLAIAALELVMSDPAYFLMARIDLAGGSTGWHRAQLIRSSLEHLGEWWAVGTDYTRHWMPTGIQANEIHTDLTNHFLQIGVWGGLPLVGLFALVLIAAFRGVGRAIQNSPESSRERDFLIWTLGALLFGHVVNFWASSPFDQSITFFYMVLATIGAVQVPVAVAARADARNPWRTTEHERRGLYDSGIGQQRRGPAAEPSFVARAAGWRA
jgi:hypothetical protein